MSWIPKSGLIFLFFFFDTQISFTGWMGRGVALIPQPVHWHCPLGPLAPSYLVAQVGWRRARRVLRASKHLLGRLAPLWLGPGATLSGCEATVAQCPAIVQKLGLGGPSRMPSVMRFSWNPALDTWASMKMVLHGTQPKGSRCTPQAASPGHGPVRPCSAGFPSPCRRCTGPRPAPLRWCYLYFHTWKWNRVKVAVKCMLKPFIKCIFFPKIQALGEFENSNSTSPFGSQQWLYLLSGEAEPLKDSRVHANQQGVAKWNGFSFTLD